MKKITFSLIFLGFATEGTAQWIGTNPLHTFSNVGIGTSLPVAPLQVQNGAVLFDGNTGSIPVSGAGTRFMWIPEKAALRFGTVTGSEWDNPRVGPWSFAGGYNSVAECWAGFAHGFSAYAGIKPGTPPEQNEANISLGYGTVAVGHVSVAIGDNSFADGGGGATAIGNMSNAKGAASIAIGGGYAYSLSGIALGRGTIVTGQQAIAIGNGEATALNALSLSTYEAKADGEQSIAMGAKANNNGHTGSFVYGEYDPNYLTPYVQNTADMQFMARARGGFVLYTDENMTQEKTTYINDGKVGIGVAAMQAKLQVKEGAILADGTFGGTAGSTAGSTPVSGAGTRLMWIPAKAAFRAGQINNNQWDDALIGRHSGAGGENTIAEPPGSFVWGLRAAAVNFPGAPQNQACISLGANTTASGWASVAIGNYCQARNASGAYAIGNNSIAEGAHSMALGGTGANAIGIRSIAIGSWSQTLGDEATAIGTYGGASGKNALSLSTYGAQATGNFSIAMGHSAANDTFQGCLSYADYDPSFSLPLVENTKNYQFMTRARGGYVFHNDANLDVRQSFTFDHGKMGIGTGVDSATEKLDINGRLRVRDIPLDATGSSEVLVKDAAGTIRYRSLSGLGSSEWRKPGGAVPTSITDTIYRNGMTGIGTSNPNAQFHVYNPPCSSTPGIRVSATPSTLACAPGTFAGNLFQADGYHGSSTTVVPKFVIRANGNVGVNTGAPKMMMDLYEGDMLLRGATNSGFRFHNQYWSPSGALLISPSDSNGLMPATGGGLAISFNGNVGIATIPGLSPADRLTVNGNAVPANSCSFNLGTSALRWNNIFLCNNPVIISDTRLKSNVQNLEYGIEEIKKLRPVTYNLKTNESEGRKIGLIAQEAKEVIREIVHEGNDEQKTLGIKYSELIPVLITAIQQQQQMIEQMMARLEQQPGSNKTRDNNSVVKDDLLKEVRLYQNTPNPFSSTTEIRYYLPEGMQQSAIVIFDLNGKQLKRFDLLKPGEGSIQVSGGDLMPGMYLYSLIADGREADTKRMVFSN